jgi:hypothetical protein
VFPKYFKTDGDAQMFDWQPERIANRVYYVTATGGWGQRYERFAEAFAAAYERNVKQGR